MDGETLDIESAKDNGAIEPIVSFSTFCTGNKSCGKKVNRNKAAIIPIITDLNIKPSNLKFFIYKISL